MAGKPPDLKERTFEFAIRMLQVTAMLPQNPEAQTVRKQLARAGLSVGTNVEEADGCETKPEARRIFIIARREARESRLLLRVIRRLWSPGINVDADIRESSELIKIRSTIILRLNGS